jgi:hypothetical protein
MLDRDPSVVSYVTQPLTISFVDENGKKRHYTPDVKVMHSDGTVEIHEVTVAERRATDSARRRERAAREVCKSRGWKYIIHTEATLPGPTMDANLNYLITYRATAYADPDVIYAIQKDLEISSDGMPIYTLVIRIAKRTSVAKPRVLSTLLHMLWHGYAETDLDKLLISDGRVIRETMVYPSGRE